MGNDGEDQEEQPALFCYSTGCQQLSGPSV